TNAGGIEAAQALTVRVNGGVTNTGAVQAGHALSLRADSLTNAGILHALDGSWKAHIGGRATNTRSGDIYAGGTLTLDAGSLAQQGKLEAVQTVAVTTDGA